MEFHNEIAPIGKLDADNFIQLRKNIPRSYRRRLELDGSFPLAGPLSLGGNFTYMKSRIREYAPTGDPKVYHNVQQALSPDLMGTVALGYHDNRRLEASLSGRFLSRSFLEPTNNPALVIPSFFILTASARLNIYKESSVYFVLDNILNKLYYTNGTPVDINMDGIPEPGYYVQAPRNFYIMLTLHI